MDNLLARSVCARPENKIAMKCPSWPDTPLHQYFGARRTNQRNSDFAISSLGYVRLYECCCPCDRNNMPREDPECQTTFVHIEERLRSDGPFILYRRPPQRRVVHGLSERAREIRLLKYYKYFQGFQRKLQVSRQFQQTHQKPENKAKVKKIINCYKPKITSQGQSTPKQLDSKETKPTASTISTSRSVNKSTVSDAGKQKAGTETTSKKKNTKVKSAAAQISAKQNELSGSGVNVHLKKSRRGTLKTRNSAAVEDVATNCDVLKSEENSNVAANCLPRVSINPVLPKKDQLQETYASHAPPASLHKEPVQLRSILKHRKETTLQKDLKNAASLEAASRLETRFEVTSPTDPEAQSPITSKPNIKSRRTRKASTSIGTSGDDISSAGGLKITEYATLKKEVLPKARRFRPVFTRMSEQLSQQLSTSDHFGNIDEFEEIIDAPEIAIENQAEQGLTEEKVKSEESIDFTVDIKKFKSHSMKSGRSRSSSRRKTNVQPENMIKFSGWDLGTSLKHHSLKKIPGDKELCTQILERAANLNWGGSDSFEAESIISCRPLTKFERQTPEEFLQEASLAQIFEHLTKSLVIENYERPFDGLQALAHDLAVQHSNLQCIHKDLKDMATAPKPQACTDYNDTSINLTLAKLASKPRQRVGSVLKEMLSHSGSDPANEHTVNRNGQ
ncbi:hypothetical protein BsWGS_16839 [Bradybaena similaris]